jgi:DNA-directed RNA polymerase subunit RPC12/RpoP
MIFTEVMIMREKFARFMAGRYGMDSLGRFTMALTLLFIVLNYFTRNRLVPLLAWAGIILTYYRMFSRNVYKRSAENQRYLSRTAKLRRWFYTQKNIFAQRKTHRIYKCPSCRQKIRVPKGKGRIEIRCPKCSATFIKKS